MTQAAREERLRVLLVEDDEETASALSTLLTFFGHDVWVAHSATEGAALAEQLKPDCAVIDVGLPDTSGYDLARRIHNSSWGKRVRMIAVTGWPLRAGRMPPGSECFVARLEKPLSVSKLCDALVAEPVCEDDLHR
jgi:CheY-like chemotaxis protein